MKTPIEFKIIINQRDTWGNVSTTPHKFENAASFQRLGLPFTLIRKRSLRKRSSSQMNLETPVLRFRADKKRFDGVSIST